LAPGAPEAGAAAGRAARLDSVGELRRGPPKMLRENASGGWAEAVPSCPKWARQAGSTESGSREYW